MTAIQLLRQEYKSYLNSASGSEKIHTLRYQRYNAKREFALELNLVSFNEVELMETEEITEYQNQLT